MVIRGNFTGQDILNGKYWQMFDVQTVFCINHRVCDHLPAQFTIFSYNTSDTTIFYDLKPKFRDNIIHWGRRAWGNLDAFVKSHLLFLSLRSFNSLSTGFQPIIAGPSSYCIAQETCVFRGSLWLCRPYTAQVASWGTEELHCNQLESWLCPPWCPTWGPPAQTSTKRACGSVFS